jgi:hypothetical protein
VAGQVDIPYGGELGFRHAIAAAADMLGQAKVVQERELLQSLFSAVAADTNLYCFGAKDVEHALVEQRSVHTVVLFADNPLVRWELVTDSTPRREQVVYLKPGASAVCVTVNRVQVALTRPAGSPLRYLLCVSLQVRCRQC